MTSRARHVRGARLITARALTCTLDRWGQWRLYHYGLQIGAHVWLPSWLEEEHFLIFGDQGRGKSSLIRSMLRQIQRRGQAAVVVDPESEFIQEFYNENRGDHILNPLDARGSFWSLWSELDTNHSLVDTQAVMSSLIRSPMVARTQSEKYWHDQGRGLLKRLLGETSTIAGLRNAIEGSKHPGQETAWGAIEPLSCLARQEDCPKAWSALEWAQTPKGWLFLTSTPRTLPTLYGLHGIWLDLIVRALMSREIGAEQVWVVADELASMGYQPAIEQVLTRGRKRGISVVASVQNIAQLRTIYGHDGAITLSSQPSTIVIFKCQETETAHWLSGLIGKELVADEHRTWEQPIVMDADIQRLAKFRAYIISGEHRAPLHIKRCFRHKHHPDFVVRPMVTTTPVAPKWEWFDDPTVENGPLNRQWKQVSYAEFTRSIWKGIKERCDPPKDPERPHISQRWYRNIGIERRFQTREEMMRHMKKPPAYIKRPSVNRLGGKGHYEPGNVEWVEYEEQNKPENKRPKPPKAA